MQISTFCFLTNRTLYFSFHELVDVKLRIDARTKDLQAQTLSKIIPTTNDSGRSFRLA